MSVTRDPATPHEGGITLADALGRNKSVFDDLFRNMVAAGEAGGILDDILARLATYIEKADALKRKIQSAMVYPAVVLTVAMGATAFMLIFIIPTFAKMFTDFGGELPLPKGAKPWTPYSLLQPPVTATGNDDGLGATCEPAAKRGWERRYHHVIFVVYRDGKMVDWWPQHDKLFQMRCGRGPHKILMNPYDKEKRIWIVDDDMH